ncbi:MAG: hypothetical protein JNL74_07345, partial [Fibrobacteres bacterium]|nr:hypothetical protein [Fibrobacterota bacterium]
MIRRIILSQTRRVCLIFGVVVILMAGCSSKTPSPISPVDNTTPFIDGNTYDNPKLKIRVTMPDTSWHMTMQEYSDLNGNTYWLAVSKRNGGALDFRSQPQGQTTGRALIQKMFWEICYTDNVYGVTPYDSTAISVDTARGLYWLDMTYYLGAT